MASTTTPETPPPTSPNFLLSYPTPFVLLVTINRPKQMNSIPYAAHWEADAIFTWFDGEPTLRVAVITGAGDRAFSAGQDLAEQHVLAQQRAAVARGEAVDVPDRRLLCHPPSGFLGLSRREGKKPVIAAVNGYAMGGGFETALGCDMIIASPTATFGLPETSKGLYAGAGGLSRLVRLVGVTVASDVALAGRTLSGVEAGRYGIANRVAASAVDEAVAVAARVAGFSPDATVVSRWGLRRALETGSVERASQETDVRFGRALRESPNLEIGLRAFAERKTPKWVPSRL